ncbi:hypothetical protein Val02_53200 [Virgisporangium aliadipatigenens]|uniref:OmpR/PhoB-type domain-containing protein n=1 Tax=Virgisporangium aliadipatigenens TaxID=741659 RepID=A0A8J3YMU1_9ACTN|nr:AfsR/SARP family transcriptional regulator [Virgisporangium aliadipatigenens]GIJ48434.1 hypothetical protein Val02_53200 [Virgisporangium aliadipatigenens]
MLFQLLGPLEIHDGEAVSRPGAGKAATVLATLLLHRNVWVAVDRIVDVVWPEHAAPPSAEANLKTYVWQLRRILPAGPAGPRIERRPGAYRLRVAPGEVDTDRVDALAAEAARADPALAVERLRAALALWRGRAFEGLHGPGLDAAATTWEERRIELTARLADRLSRAGQGAEAVATLRALTVDAPLREQTWSRLVLALHATGHRADALAAYRRARHLLRTELGVEPGPALAEAHRAVLAASEAARDDLPRDVPLTGRTAELARLRRIAAGDAPVVVIDGLIGVGKTAFAVHAAHRLADGYPDGRLFVPVGTAPPEAILTRLLRALDPSIGSTVDGPTSTVDVPGRSLVDGRIATTDAVAADGRSAAMDADAGAAAVDVLAARWRAALRGRRVLLVLDDVADGDRLAPLLPAAPGCLTLVTTGRRDWHPDGAARMTLHPLGDGDAALVLRSALAAHSATRPGRDADAAVAAIVRRCAGLPAALGDVAARSAVRPQWTVRRLAEEVARDPGPMFGERVRRSVATATRRLDGPALAAWHALARLPAAFGAVAAARILRTTPAAARAALETLVDRGLLEPLPHDAYRAHPALLPARRRPAPADLAVVVGTPPDKAQQSGRHSCKIGAAGRAGSVAATLPTGGTLR